MRSDNSPSSQARESFADIDLIDVLVGVWQRKLLILGCALVGLGLAVLYLVFATPNYVSEVRVLIDRTESDLIRPVEASPDPATQLQFDKEAVESQVQIILSRDLAIEVGRALNLQDEPDFRSSGGIMALLGLGGGKKSSEESFLEAYFDRLVVYPVRESRVIGVVFRSSDPELAANVANTLVAKYLEAQSRAKADATEEASEWLEQQIAVLRGRLAEAEARVQAFRAKHGLFEPRDNQSLDSQQLAELNTELIRAKAQRSEAQARATMLRGMLKSGADIESASEIVQSGLMQRLVEQRVALRGQISELSATLGPRHPRLLELQAELGALSAQMRNEALNIAESFENEARLAGAREAALAESLDAQKTLASLSEEQQIELRSLEREATTQRELLQVYLTRFGEAIARQEPKLAAANARVVSTARAALEPATPKKAASLFIGGFVGFLLGFVAAMTRAILSAQTAYQVQPDGVDAPLSAAIAQEPAPVHPAQNAVPQPTTVITPYATVRSADELVAHMMEMTRTYGFCRLLCVYEGDRSLMPRQLVRGLSRLGRSCLLVEWAAGEGPGLSNALKGEVELADVITRDRVSAAHIIPGGTAGPDMDFTRLETALKALQQAYEYVLVSCSEGQVSKDVLELAPQVFLTHQPARGTQSLLSFAEQVLVFSPLASQPATSSPQHAHISA